MLPFKSLEPASYLFLFKEEIMFIDLKWPLRYL